MSQTDRYEQLLGIAFITLYLAKIAVSASVGDEFARVSVCFRAGKVRVAAWGALVLCVGPPESWLLGQFVRFARAR